MTRIVVLMADLVALLAAALWFGSYQWWMFYAFLASVVVIETSLRSLKRLREEHEKEPPSISL